MQAKTLALVAAAVATTAAQSISNNACSTCVYSSIPNDTICTTLPASSLTQVSSYFASTGINSTALATLAQDPAIRSCVCHWADTCFSTTGSAFGCLTGAAPVCTMADLAVKISIVDLADILHCGATTSSVAASSGPIATSSGPIATNPATIITENHSSGAIIGGVVGGLVVVAIIVSYFVYQRRKSKRTSNNTGPQKLEVQQWDNGHPSHKIQNRDLGNPSLPPMSQPPVFQQQSAFSTHPKPSVSTYMSDFRQQQQQLPPKAAPLVWEPTPFVPPTAASGDR
ncbi:hypothetical protein BGZ83_005209 [Gryganskiella cystojenkinii]|nr:hypothetical protein BGZ83_005209 [Gryganskiella cystojenkinii]